MVPGQPNRWTLDQWWKVLMLAGWDHIWLLKPALSSTNGHQHRSRQLDSIRTFSPILATPPVTCGSASLVLWANMLASSQSILGVVAVRAHRCRRWSRLRLVGPEVGVLALR